MKRRVGFNSKRTILPAGGIAAERLADLARQVRYDGNPEHKRHPGDYGLVPAAAPRPGKTLCDPQAPFPRREALRLLRHGLAKGMVSPVQRDEWPQNIWSVSPKGICFEAQLENRTLGIYHGYPMPQEDDFRTIVASEWQSR